ncbi:MAG: GC-type dockerin domain-anchored protein [Phycisphaerales bacterium]|nr:GC-type dockerin domain-anchored protein [Phycisphaerales bacterium]
MFKGNELLTCSGMLAVAAGTVVAMASPAPTPVRNPGLPGIDVAVSAIASSRSSATRDILIYNQGSTSVASGSMPAGSGMFTMALGTTSCNQQVNNGPPTTRIPSGTGIVAGSPFWLADWYQAWESGPNWDGTALGNNAGNRHPYIAQAVYRLNAAGRLDQLATSWVKHSWSAASGSQAAVAGSNGSDICGNGTCLNLATDNQLEANCADTYGSGLNADQYWMGPRSEIATLRPWSVDGANGWNNPGWSKTGSYMDSYTSTDTLVANVAQRTDGVRSLTGGTIPAWKLNMVRYDEVDQAALGTSGRVICEGYYVVNGDNYQLNNVAHRQFTSSLATGAATIASSNLTMAGRQIWGPAVLQWGELKSIADPATDGEVYISSRAVDQGDGTWRYEYCVYNHNLDRQISSFEVPVPSFATKTSLGSAQPRTNWPGYDSNAAWTSSYDNAKKAIVWTHPAPPVLDDAALAALKPPMPAGTVIKPNTLRWGQMFTFWFVSDLSPSSAGISQMDMASPGSFTGQLSAEVRAPRHPADLGVQGGNAGSDGLRDNNDFIVFIDLFFNASPLADLGQQGGIPGADGSFDNNDFVVFIDFFFQS